MFPLNVQFIHPHPALSLHRERVLSFILTSLFLVLYSALATKRMAKRLLLSRLLEGRTCEAVVFTATQPSGLAGLSLPLGHKKRGRALGPTSVVCSQFGKLTKLLPRPTEGCCLVGRNRQWAFRINIRPWTIYSRCSLQRTFECNSHSTVSVASYANRRRLS